MTQEERSVLIEELTDELRRVSFHEGVTMDETSRWLKVAKLGMTIIVAIVGIVLAFQNYMVTTARESTVAAQESVTRDLKSISDVVTEVSIDVKTIRKDVTTIQVTSALQSAQIADQKERIKECAGKLDNHVSHDKCVEDCNR